MKTAKSVLWFFILSLILSNFSFSQNDYSDEITIYLSSGISALENGEIDKIESKELNDLLIRFDISKNNITSAFPKFKEIDTIKILPNGKEIKMPNLAKIFIIKTKTKTACDSLTELLSKLPIVIC